jgi:hypothetical protein
MRFPYLLALILLSTAAVGASACGGVNRAQGSGTGGGGGGGGEAGDTTTTSTTTTTTTTSLKDAGLDVDNGMVSTVYPAPHPAPPQVINGGGAVLDSPKLVPVFYPNDPLQSQINDFTDKLGASTYWTAATAEYGVGSATGQSAVVLTETAPTTIDDNGIQTWLAGKLNGDDMAWPTPDQNTLYILHYPANTTITQSSGGQTLSSCVDFGGYHNSVTLDAAHNSLEVAYAVIPRCSNFNGLHGIDAVTGAESHEIVEAATDPHPMADTAYGQVDNAHIYWELALGGGETADLCAQFPGVFTKFSGLDYTVQRSWSNASAKAGHDPCVPQPIGEIYFNSAPLVTDSISLSGFAMKGVKIPVGSSKTIDIDLFSDGDTGGPWDVAVQDFSELMGGSATMGFSLDRSSGQNGEKLHLTIDVLKKSPYGAGVFIVVSQLGSRHHWWLGLVGS